MIHSGAVGLPYIRHHGALYYTSIYDDIEYTMHEKIQFLLLSICEERNNVSKIVTV